MTTIPGVGAQYPQPDKRGWLVFHGLPNDLQNAEDATLAHDYTRPVKPVWDTESRVWTYPRPATATERALLAHLGYTLPDDLVTVVEWKTETLRQRRWPALETT